jgi:LacI family transcriptional regulator
MREVAERAGVAMSSVSRVLSDHADVSPRMRELVNAAVRDLGYRPDMLAQGLRTRKTFSVGFTVSDIANPVLASAITGAEKRLRQAGYSLLLTNSEGDPELDAENIRLLQQRRVDGLILSLAEERHPATVALLREADVPIVLLDRDVPEGAGVSRVIFNHRAGMAAATRHLLELGHREIALIVGGPQGPARERRLGVEEAIAAAANGSRCLVYEGPFSVAYGEQAAQRILDSETGATAIIAGGNLLMHGALRALRERGVALGVDLSFVGCDDVAVAEVHTPQIAVVRRDMISIGEASADLLLDLLKGATGTKEITLPTEFVRRPSCAPPGGARA